MKNTYLLLMLAAVLAACSSTRNAAPVVDRSMPGKPVVEAAKPVVVAPRAPDAHGFYTVRKGDTLIRIALDHGQNYRDLVTWNSLANPNDIKVDQVLRVLPPESGLTSGSVAVQSVPNPASTSAEAKPAVVAVPNKNWPLGEKRPYSEATLAEMQKADSPGAVKKPQAKLAEVVAAPASNLPSPADDEQIAWIWPTEGKVIASFDEGKNKGIDIAGRAGQQVLAAGSGKVMYAGSGIRGYGNLVIVKHGNNLLSAYAHNQNILVKEGQTVNRGQTIAEMGSSDSDSVKLHFEIRQQGKPVDPMRFLPAR